MDYERAGVRYQHRGGTHSDRAVAAGANLAEGLNQALIDLARGAILRNDASITKGEIRRRLAERRLGMELAARVHNFAVGIAESDGEACVDMATIEVALLVIEQLETCALAGTDEPNPSAGVP